MSARGGCNKAPQTGELKPAETYHLTVLEDRSPRPRYLEALLPWGPPGEGPPFSLAASDSSGVPQLPASGLYLDRHTASLGVCVLSSQRTPVLGSGSTLFQDELDDVCKDPISK